MWFDLRKGVRNCAFSTISTLNAFDAIVAMNLKLTMIILWSFCYTHQEFQAPIISGVGVASTHTTCGQKSAILYLWFDGHHFWQEAIYSFKRGICEVEGLMCPWTKNKVRVPHCFEMVIAWMCRIWHFAWSYLFSQIRSHIIGISYT